MKKPGRGGTGKAPNREKRRAGTGKAPYRGKRPAGTARRGLPDYYCDMCGRLIEDTARWPQFCSAGCAAEMVTPDMDEATMSLWLMAAAAAKTVAHLKGPVSREWAHAAECLRELSDGRLSPAAAGRLLAAATEDHLPPVEDMYAIPVAIRTLLMRLAVDVALVDNRVTAEEMAHLRYLCARLGGTPAAVDDLLSRMGAAGPASSGPDEDYLAACALLGVDASARSGEIRNAYKKMVREHHPDLAPPDRRAAATAKTAEINAAYDLLMAT